jgi:hypothetical protein
MPSHLVFASLKRSQSELDGENRQQRRQTENGQRFELTMAVGVFAVGRCRGDPDHHECHDIIGGVSEGMNGVAEDRKRTSG